MKYDAPRTDLEKLRSICAHKHHIPELLRVLHRLAINAPAFAVHDEGGTINGGEHARAFQLRTLSMPPA